MYKAEIVADSVALNGKRLTTMVVTYPRFVHSEMLTHRMFSRNSSSSRAIPVERLVQQVMDDPVLPVWWGKNQPGMQAEEEVGDVEKKTAMVRWLWLRDQAVEQAKILRDDLGLHKQIANRLLEPWMWITVIISATEWENFFRLRCSPLAQPEIRKIAEMMRHEMNKSIPAEVPRKKEVYVYKYHLPFVSDEEREEFKDEALLISVGRCARVSYLSARGMPYEDRNRESVSEIALARRLRESGHWSPFEHQARPLWSYQTRTGNFFGWEQYRSLLDPDYIR